MYPPVIISSVKSWSTDPDNVDLVAKLESAGVLLEDDPEPSSPGGGQPSDLLTGVSVVVSGTLESMSREEAEAAVVTRGGKATSGVSKKTTFLVVGANPGANKVTKAAESGVPTIDETGFLRLLETGTAE